MGVVFVDLAGNQRDELRDKLLRDILAQGCWAREECGDGIGLRTDLPRGLTKDDLRAAVSGVESARGKVSKVANSEVGEDWKHPDGYFWDFDGFLVYSRDDRTGQVTLTTLDESGRVSGTARGEGATLAKKKWDRRAWLKRALKPLWQRFSP